MRARTRAFCVLFALGSGLATLSGCVENQGELGSQDPHSPGEALGFYSVAGKLSDDSCGAETLGAPEEWSFEVKLSRDGTTLYWLNGREGIVGDIDKAGSFSFETRVDVPLSETRGAVKGCTIERRDAAKGALTKSEDALTLKLTYSYSEKSGSNCEEFVGVQAPTPNPLPLPCTMTYSLSGKRIATE
jgi:hypothetical protein